MKIQWIAIIGLLGRRQFRKFLREIDVDFIEVKNWGESVFFTKTNLNEEQINAINGFREAINNN